MSLQNHPGVSSVRVTDLIHSSENILVAMRRGWGREELGRRGSCSRSFFRDPGRPNIDIGWAALDLHSAQDGGLGWHSL